MEYSIMFLILTLLPNTLFSRFSISFRMSAQYTSRLVEPSWAIRREFWTGKEGAGVVRGGTRPISGDLGEGEIRYSPEFSESKSEESFGSGWGRRGVLRATFPLAGWTASGSQLWQRCRGWGAGGRVRSSTVILGIIIQYTRSPCGRSS